jgi:hypothetical protein
VSRLDHNIAACDAKGVGSSSSESCWDTVMCASGKAWASASAWTSTAVATGTETNFAISCNSKAEEVIEANKQRVDREVRKTR